MYFFDFSQHLWNCVAVENVQITDYRNEKREKKTCQIEHCTLIMF